MTNPTFLQIHTLTSYPGTLLNRDDAGFAKRLPFGGVSRTRVSSQCLKRHWRTFEGQNSLSEIDVDRSYRSRYTFQLKVSDILIENGYPKALTIAVVCELIDQVLGRSKSRAEETDLMTSQLTVMGEPELKYLREIAATFMDSQREDFAHLFDSTAETLSKDDLKKLEAPLKAMFTKDMQKNLKGMALAAGLDAALFGRMVTSDMLARGNAAIHVAHAITVHEEAHENDYFAAIDDLQADAGGGDLGSAHINSTELTSGLFYGYVVIDLPLLVSNLTGCSPKAWLTADRELAAQVVERIIQLIATVTPGAKLGSTAPYSNAQCVLIEAGNAQPRTLANAFQKPVTQRPDVLENTYQALAKHIRESDGMYGKTNQRTLSAMGDAAGLADSAGVEKITSVPEAAAWAANLVRG